MFDAGFSMNVGKIAEEESGPHHREAQEQRKLPDVVGDVPAGQSGHLADDHIPLP